MVQPAAYRKRVLFGERPLGNTFKIFKYADDARLNIKGILGFVEKWLANKLTQ